MRQDIKDCAEILRAVYNNELWQCRWDEDTSQRYISDYFDSAKFVGYCCIEDGKFIGAILCHEKVWWNNSELFVDEMFILPSYQGKGYGSSLINEAENYVREHKFAGFTLSTNKYAPAPKFYKKNGFTEAGHVLYMYKEV